MRKPLIVIGAIALVATSGVGAFFIATAMKPSMESASSPQTTAEEPDVAQETIDSAEDLVQELSEETTAEDQLAQQDVAAKNAVSVVASGLMSYAANNRGAYPNSVTAVNGFAQTYLTPTSITNPVTNEPYGIAFHDAADMKSSISYHPGSRCTTDGTSVEPSGSTRTFALFLMVPSGSPYCLNS